MHRKLIFTLLLIASCVAVPLSKEEGEKAQLVLLTKDSRSACLDGSPSGYYFKPAASKSASRKFVINLEGGGECVSKDDCISRSKSELGSSKNWTKTTTLTQIQDDNCNKNVDFCDWNQVFVKYCSGDLWSGRRMVPTEESFGLIFSGHINLRATLDDLKLNHHLDSAEKVIFTGTSAGGIGTFLNLDFVAEYLPNAVVLGVPIAGFYFPTFCYTGPGKKSDIGVPFTPEAWPEYTKLWESFLPTACAEAQLAGEEWKCMMANYSYPTLKTPVYIVEAQTDSVQMSLHDCVNVSAPITGPLREFITEWSHNMTSALQTALAVRPEFGLFNPACLIHTTFEFKHPMISGFNFFESLKTWLDHSGTAPPVLVDNCGILCNPTCPKT